MGHAASGGVPGQTLIVAVILRSAIERPTRSSYEPFTNAHEPVASSMAELLRTEYGDRSPGGLTWWTCRERSGTSSPCSASPDAGQWDGANARLMPRPARAEPMTLLMTFWPRSIRVRMRSCEKNTATTENQTRWASDMNRP